MSTYWTSSSTSSVSDILLWMSSAKWIPISLFLDRQIYVIIKQPRRGGDGNSSHSLHWVSVLTQISVVTIAVVEKVLQEQQLFYKSNSKNASIKES